MNVKCLSWKPENEAEVSGLSEMMSCLYWAYLLPCLTLGVPGIGRGSSLLNNKAVFPRVVAPPHP